MTLALIVGIFFLIVWGWQTIINIIGAKYYKKRTRTNIALEQEILGKWCKQIKKDLSYIPDDDVSPFDDIYQLYIKYNVPLTLYNEDIDIEEERKMAKREDERDTPSRLGKDEKWPRHSVVSAKTYNSPEERDAYARVQESHTAKRYCNNLIMLLTHHDVKQAGFAPSPDGKHDSPWQEAEKAEARLKENKKKYPGFFD